ncbi:Asp-tRNA(Asn)/Glu-tRNA(Gln) amidotransferase subunit GatC [Alkalicella caledoniensis]|uniref:Asp-tRNA(Asn)/Glu-tRNA(Gln) amidotransferase subunit GatC n=1 Tax=Alkalicella caledoniensis TaxID=2731377 RepID=A0A7G9W9C2_ALKCA|nr:Asp-tRNA(Asn)/Glu-tRNA(Gln) amidotransferase subunit GatC [Alkalicella caledoniensis]QNO15284.1 Asp-tRNA(Asn)/Glu-tRNA(Gln) amidotransferase subunit GatC [Alkalicella caledoniensis]
MGVSEKEVKRLAELCKLKFGDEELSIITDRINKVVKDTDKIQGVNIKEYIQTDLTKNTMRADVSSVSFTTEEALANSSNKKDEFIAVPSVLVK